MKFKTLVTLVILTTFLISGIATKSFTQESKQLFQQGLMKENGEGNLQDAINIYEKIVADESAENSVKAKAQLHIGLCYEKMGKEEAIKAYELVIQNYRNYEDEVQLASSRLSKLLIVVDDEDMVIINLYDKGADVAKGTMLENSALSPDGAKLVGIDFTLGQNVALYDLKTKKIKLITNYDWTTEGHGWTYFPAWSPDGKEVVYMYSDWSGGNMEVHISNLQGEKRTLISKPTSAQIIPRQWSNDGKNILTFIQDSAGYYTIALVSVKDGTITPLHKTQWTGKFIIHDKGDASISPDGKYVVFSDGPVDNLDLFIMDTQGGSPSKISSYPTNEHSPLWSPDGEHIVFIKETKGESFLYGLSIKNGKPQGLAFMIKEGMQNVSLDNWIEQGICSSMFIDLHDIYTLPMDPDTGIPSGAPEPIDYTPTGSNVNPVWSHDGKYLAFISYDVEPEVVILSLNGGDARYYTIPDPGLEVVYTHDLRWLPDNSGIGLSTIDVLEKPVLYRLDLASSEWQHWSLPASGHTLTAWGPDENTVIYTDNNVSAPGLYQLNIKTKESKNIFKPEKEDWYMFGTIKFSRDHKKMVFYMHKGKVMLYDFETGECSVFAEGYGAATFSPDGHTLLAANKSNLNFFSPEGEVVHKYNLKQHFPSDTRIWGYDWSPDGKQIVFMTRTMIFETSLMKNVLK
jgi:Tol biopolymer transport system component